MSKVVQNKFTEEEEEKLIEFVKNNEELYNIHHKRFRDFEAKNGLWLLLSEELGKEVDSLKKKWFSMRDYFIRKQKKYAEQQGVVVQSKREDSMMFLMDTLILKHKSLGNANSKMEYLPETNTDSHDVLDIESVDIEQNDSIGTPFAPPSSSSSYNAFEPTSIKIKKQEKENKNEQTELLRTLINMQRSESVPIISAQPPKDNLDQFFQAITSTIRTFPPLEIAKVKFEISHIVGRKEIELAEQNAINSIKTEIN